MKILLIFCLLNICVNVYSQSILSDKNNVSTKTRSIKTGTNPIYQPGSSRAIQVQSQLDVQNDLVTSYQVDFTAPALPAAQNGDNDSLSNTCLLTDENGVNYRGILNNESSGASQQVYSCKFSKNDLFKIVALKITSVQLTRADGKTATFQTDKKLQNIISQQAKVMLKQLKNDAQ